MPTHSSYPPVDIPDVDIFTHLFENKARPYPDEKIIYTDAENGRSSTNLDVKAAALEFGKGLKSVWEWQKGDVLGIYSPNSIDIPVIIWGTLWTGGVVSPANPSYNVDELAFQLKDSGAKALVTQPAQLKTAIEAAARTGIPEDRIILVGDERDASGRYKHFASIRNVAGTARFRKAKIDPKNDLAFLVYSSGTTGRPKGVMLTHTNIVANVMQSKAAESADLTWNGGIDGKGDRVLGFLPFFHIYGMFSDASISPL